MPDEDKRAENEREQTGQTKGEGKGQESEGLLDRAKDKNKALLDKAKDENKELLDEAEDRLKAR